MSSDRTSKDGTGSPRNTIDLIDRKRTGGELAADEIAWFCDGFVAGRIPDYQAAALLMAICIRGMSERETVALTQAMVASGDTLDWTGLPKPAVDKHSTGGVGDKISLVLTPLIAAAGLPFVKMSGRGLGHTGGTIDKLESIPGFRTALSPEEMRTQVERIGCALVSQGPSLVPADRKLYALRDCTGTVEATPLIASSIMSKKIAAGARVILLDVKWGAGAFMPTLKAARELAAAMLAIGRGTGRRIGAVLTSMDEPLGSAVGNALEVQEAVETLGGRRSGEPSRGFGREGAAEGVADGAADGAAEVRELVLVLGSQLLLLAGEAKDEASARARLSALLDSGAALARFRALVEAQGGDPGVADDPARLPAAPRVSMLEADRAGWVERLDARGVAEAALSLGAGRRERDERVDPAVGVRLRVKSGGRVEPGTPLAEIHASDADSEVEAHATLRKAFRISSAPVRRRSQRPEVMLG